MNRRELIKAVLLKLKSNDTLTITGTGTLTSEIVEQAIGGRTDIHKLVLVGFNNLETIPFSTSIDNQLTSIEFGFLPNMQNGKAFASSCDTYIIKGTGTLNSSSGYRQNWYWVQNTYIKGFNSFIFNDNWGLEKGANTKYIYLEDVETFGCKKHIGQMNFYLPKAITIYGDFGQQSGTSNINKYFIGTDNLTSSGTYATIYVKANKLVSIKNASLMTNSVFIGVVDGNDVYSNKGFNYPKLSTTLTINSNGHLIENGVDLFDGYTATWYSDENCTQVIIDLSTITTAYVKLELT